MKRTVWHSVVSVLLVVLVCIGGSTVHATINRLAAGSTCTVNGNGGANYTIVQDAIDDSACRQINIAPGTYFEDLLIRRDVVLHGVSQDQVILDGVMDNPVLNIVDNTRVDATGLTIQHGTNGILNRGTLVISDSTIKLNTAPFIGGAIDNIHNATFVNVTLSDNKSGDNGGGIYGETGSQTDIIGSTMRNNISGGFGNSIYVKGDDFFHIFAHVNILDSTIYDSGNAIVAFNTYSVIRITNSTVSHNNTGLDSEFGGQIILTNTIVANNNYNCSAPIVSAGHNIEDTNVCGLKSPGDHPNSDPHLGPLQNNGGATATQALLPDSPAIDAGSNTDCPKTDQRGELRPIDGDNDHLSLCDVGAYEYNPFAALSVLITSLSSDATVVGGHGFTLTVYGRNFINGATLQWNGKSHPTVFVNSTQLQVAISAADIANAGTAIMMIVNPDATVSNGINFTIRDLKTYLPFTQR